MKCESEPGTNKIVKTSTRKKGSLVKNLGSDRLAIENKWFPYK